MKDAEKSLFTAAEGEIGDWSGGADIDGDISGGRFVAEFAGRRTAGGKERGLIAIRTAAKKFHGFVNGIGVNQAEHGAEYFRMSKLAVCGQAVQNRGRQEISRSVLWNFCVAPIDDRLGAFANACGNQRFDALLAFFRNDRAHLHTGVEAIADADRTSSVRDGVAESFLRFANGDGDGNSESVLAGAAKCTVADDVGGGLHVCVRP